MLVIGIFWITGIVVIIYLITKGITLQDPWNRRQEQHFHKVLSFPSFTIEPSWMARLRFDKSDFDS
jgi:hypothetical protein